MWSKIENLPDIYKETKRMFVVIGIGIPRGTANNYTTDPYCVWRNEDGTFERWPHDFQPTHFYELPLATISIGAVVHIKEDIDDATMSTINLPRYIKGRNLLIEQIDKSNNEKPYHPKENPLWVHFVLLGYSKNHLSSKWICPIDYVEL